MKNANELAANQGCYYSPEHAEKPIKFAETYLRTREGKHAGKPLKLLSWQKEVLRQLYGNLRPNGERRYKRFYLQVARRNGKSLIGSIVCAYALVAEGLESPYIVSAATSTEQARIIHDNLAYWLRPNPAVNVVDYRSTIKYKKNHGTYRALSSKDSVAHGRGLDVGLIDELHVWSNTKLYQAIITATKDRPNALVGITTTSGTDRTSLCYEMYQYARGILDGSNPDTTFLPIIYEADEDCELDDPRQWKKANPSCPEVLPLSVFEDEMPMVKQSAHHALSFKQLHLNRWTEYQAEQFIPLGSWDECRQGFPSLDRLPCFLGLDLSVSNDLSAITQVIPHNGKYYVRSYGFICQHGFQLRETSNQVKFSIFREEGSLEITDGDAVDYERIREKIRELDRDNPVREIVCDPSFALDTQLTLGREGFTCSDFPQRANYFNSPMMHLERMVNSHQIVHDGNGLLRFCMNNLVAKEDSIGRLYPDRTKSKDKIDLVVALLMALYRAVSCDASGEYEVEESVYDSQEIMWI